MWARPTEDWYVHLLMQQVLPYPLRSPCSKVSLLPRWHGRGVQVSCNNVAKLELEYDIILQAIAVMISGFSQTLNKRQSTSSIICHSSTSRKSLSHHFLRRRRRVKICSGKNENEDTEGNSYNGLYDTSMSFKLLQDQFTSHCRCNREGNATLVLEKLRHS